MKSEIVYPKCKNFKVIYSFIKQNGESANYEHEIEFFKSLEECFEFIANHEKKDDLKFIKIQSCYLAKKGCNMHGEYIDYFLWNYYESDVGINTGNCGLQFLIPNNMGKK